MLAGQPDVQDADLVAKGVAVDAERARRAPEISRGALYGSHDVLLLEFFLGQVERDSVSQKLIDDLLELPVQIQIPSPPRENESKWRAS
jgi:hypothetical protein